MGSVGSPSPYAAYDTYRDCSRAICSINCRQWCYIIFPPPPLEKDDSTTFSPLIIAIICILGSAFLLVSYYTIVTRYCRRRRSRRNIEFEAHHDEVTHDQWQVGTTTAGLDETLIKSITVFKYKKGDGLVEGTECAVCLNQFQENESLRLLPKCCHAFHPPCIDTWLKSHSSCPICRADVNPVSPILPPPAPSSRTSSTLNISSLEIQRQNDLIFIIEDHQERSTHQAEVSMSPVSDVISFKDPLQFNSDLANSETGNCIIGNQEEAGQIRRSFSLGTFSRQRNLLVADVLRINEDDHGGSNTGICQSGIAIGSSKGIQEGQIKTSRELDLLARGPAAAVKRSFSTGRFQFNKAR